MRAGWLSLIAGAVCLGLTGVSCAQVVSESFKSSHRGLELRALDFETQDYPKGEGSPEISGWIDPESAHVRSSRASADKAALHVRISTPSDYMRGERSDYQEVGDSSVFSEHAFVIRGDSLSAIRVANTRNGLPMEKPFYESLGLSVNFERTLACWDTLPLDFENNELTLVVGSRYLKTQESYNVYATGGFFYGSYSSSSYVENDLLGSQVGLSWKSKRGDWSFLLESSALVGYNYTTAQENSSYQEYFISDAFYYGVNRLPYYSSRTIHYGAENDVRRFATVGEVRVVLARPVLAWAQFKIGYTGYYFSALHSYADQHVFTLPIANPLSSSDGTNYWFDQFFASVEWRR